MKKNTKQKLVKLSIFTICTLLLILPYKPSADGALFKNLQQAVINRRATFGLFGLFGIWKFLQLVPQEES